jgi:hypothetical protein
MIDTLISVVVGLFLFLAGVNVGIIWCHAQLDSARDLLERAKKNFEDAKSLVDRLQRPSRK